jgi:hypothetical protein
LNGPYNYVNDLTFFADSNYQISTICDQSGGTLLDPVRWDYCYTSVNTVGIGNTGTQLDGMGHIHLFDQNDDKTFWNNFKGSDVLDDGNLEYKLLLQLHIFSYSYAHKKIYLAVAVAK